MLFLLSLLACDDQIFTGGGGHSAVEGSSGEAILSASCAGCHASSLAPNLSENICDNTVGVTATQTDMPYITAGDPENSYLLHKMKGTGGTVGGSNSIMPTTGGLSEADVKAVEDWIAAGAVCSSTSTTEDTGDATDTGDVEDTGTPIDTNEMDQGIPEGADAIRGGDLFNQHCNSCHGSWAPDPQTIIPDIGNAAIESAILNGKGGMQPVTAVTEQADIDDIIAYLRTTYPSPDQNQGGGGDTGTPTDTGDTGGDNAAYLAMGEQLVQDNCVSCHDYAVNNAPSFASVISTLSVQELESVIVNGKGYTMPSFANFTQEELNAITFYLSETYNN